MNMLMVNDKMSIFVFEDNYGDIVFNNENFLVYMCMLSQYLTIEATTPSTS